jgi:hypothetical protein
MTTPMDWDDLPPAEPGTQRVWGQRQPPAKPLTEGLLDLDPSSKPVIRPTYTSEGEEGSTPD